MAIEVGTYLRHARKDLGLTLKQVAENVGTSLEYLHEIETGKASPSIEMLSKIAEALDLVVKLEPRASGTTRIGRKIRSRRRELDLTQAELAKMIGCHVVTVQKWEGGTISNIEIKNIVALANALQLPAASLVTAYCEDLGETEKNKNEGDEK